MVSEIEPTSRKQTTAKFTSCVRKSSTAVTIFSTSHSQHALHPLLEEIPCGLHGIFDLVLGMSSATTPHIVPAVSTAFAPAQPAMSSLRPPALLPRKCLQCSELSTMARFPCSCRSSYFVPSTLGECVSLFGRWPRWDCCR